MVDEMGITGINVDVGSVLSGIGSLAKDLRMAITGDLSAEKQAEIQTRLLEMEAQAMQAQVAVNIEEAKSQSLFKSGWRPAVGWVCVTALFYHYIGSPLFHYAVQFWSIAVPQLPKLDMGELMTLLFGLLGLGAYRTYERVAGGKTRG
jgi:hypothetical protein